MIGTIGAGATAGFAPGATGITGATGFTAVTVPDAGIGDTPVFGMAAIAMADAATGMAWLRRGGTTADVIDLSFGGGTPGSGALGCTLLSADVDDGETRGGGITMLDGFFGASASTRAVPEGEVPGVPGVACPPEATVAGRGGRAPRRVVGGGGGGTEAVFFISVTGG